MSDNTLEKHGSASSSGNADPVHAAASRPSLGTFSTVDLLLFSVVLIWGTNLSVTKFALAEITPMAFVGLRIGLSSLTLLVLFRVIEGDLRFQRADWLRLGVIGLVGHTIFQLLFILGLNYTWAGHSSLMLGLTPVFVALIGLALRIERVSAHLWASIWLAFLGVALITFGAATQVQVGGPTVLGDLLSLAASFCWASYTVLAQPLLSRYSPLKVTTATMLLGAGPLVILSIPALLAQDWRRVSVTGWLELLYSYGLAVVFAYIVWYLSVQRVGSARTALLSNLVPVVGLAAAWLLRDETLTPLQFVGAVIVIIGIHMARRG